MDTEEHENDRTRLGPAEGRDCLTALAANLPPAQDAYLKQLIDSAFKRSPRNNPEVHALVAAFAAGSYTDADLRAALNILDTSRNGVTHRTHLCAWMLGVPLLRSADRRTVANVLRALLWKSPGAILTNPDNRLGAALKWSGAFAVSATALTWVVSLFLIPDLAYATFLRLAVTLSLVPFPILLISLNQRESERARELRFIAAHSLGRLQEVEALDALAAACLDTDGSVAEMASISLRALLPNLTPEDYGRLGNHLAPGLCRLLLYHHAYAKPTTRETSGTASLQFGPRHWPDGRNPSAQEIADFEVEILGALEKVGDARAIPAVAQFMRRCPPGPLLDAARLAADALEERRRRETERATLVRGAERPAAPDDELLRAASPGTESRPEQLLRPSD